MAKVLIICSMYHGQLSAWGPKRLCVLHDQSHVA